MDKSKLASIGERLKLGGAQMGRMMSMKMREVKEMMQAPTPESKIVDQATSPTMESPDWGLNLRICAMINSEEMSGNEVVRAVKRKIGAGDGDVHCQRLALELLEACAMNCEKVFSEIASEKLLEKMVNVIEDPQSERECSVRAMEMIRAWGESEELNYLPVFRQTLENLKEKGMPSHNSMDSYIDDGDEESLSPPDAQMNGASGTVFPYNYGGLSVEGKKEFLEITRNSLDVLSSLLNSASESETDLPKDDLTMSMLNKCKESQPVLQRIIETTTEDETLLFEALNLHDELQQVVSKFSSLQVSEPSIAQLTNQTLDGTEQPRSLEAENNATADISEPSVVQLPQELQPTNPDSHSEITQIGEAESKSNSDPPPLIECP